MVLASFVIVPVLSGVVIYLLPKEMLKFNVVAVELAMCAIVCFSLFNLAQGEKHRVLLGANDAILGISLTADKNTYLLIALSIILFSLCFIYSLSDAFFTREFAMLFFMLQGLLCGVFLSDDLFNIYVLLEVATVIVALLIMFKREARSIYDGMIYLLSQVVCMVFYLFGVGYMYKIFGVLSIEQISLMISEVPSDELVMPFAFMMTGICLKSAFFPLFSWLPRAHGTPSAPSAVSAILSGLYVKNGIYLFFVMFNLFSPVLNMENYFIIIASITAICGFVMAIVQTDFKLILAFHTISQIGLIALAFSVGTENARIGAFYHLINHAFFKSLLFLAAGVIIKNYATRDIRKMQGVLKTMPLAAISVIVGVLGITGAPFFNGSVSKYFMQSGAQGTAVEFIMHVINAGTILSFTKILHILPGKKQTALSEGKISALKKFTLIILSAFCLLGGVFGQNVISFIADKQFEIDMVSYAQKALVFFVMSACCYAFYKFVIAKNNGIYKFQKYSLNFQQIVMAMLVFFIATAIFASF